MNSYPSSDENFPTPEEQEVENLLKKQLGDFKASPTIDLESAILNKINTSSKSSSRHSSMGEWRLLAAAAIFMIGMSFLFFQNNQSISDAEYIDDSISLVKLFDDTMDSMDIGSGELTNFSSVEDMVWSMSGKAILDDIALLTFNADKPIESP